MCLIIATTAAKLRATLLTTPDLLEDIYESNPDGIGAMYTTTRHGLRTPKMLPRNVRDAETFVRSLPTDDRQIAIHFRLRTHGATDLANCHPYTIVPRRVAMMHNGILPHGNAPDPTKSDTWHYINGYLQPLLEAYPKAFTNIGVQNLIESDITGSNRFVIMDEDGELVILNKDTGIMVGDMWFSNTYAWSPEMLIPGWTKPVYHSPKYGSSLYNDDWMGGANWPRPAAALTYGSQGAAAESTDDEPDITYDYDDVDPAAAFDSAFAQMEADIWEAADDGDAEVMTLLLEERPRFTLATLFKDGNFRVNQADIADMSGWQIAIAEELRLKKLDALTARIEVDGSADAVAEVLCWYGLWESPTSVGEPAAAPTPVAA